MQNLSEGFPVYMLMVKPGKLDVDKQFFRIRKVLLNTLFSNTFIL